MELNLSLIPLSPLFKSRSCRKLVKNNDNLTFKNFFLPLFQVFLCPAKILTL